MASLETRPSSSHSLGEILSVFFFSKAVKACVRGYDMACGVDTIVFHYFAHQMFQGVHRLRVLVWALCGGAGHLDCGEGERWGTPLAEPSLDCGLGTRLSRA